MDHLLEVGFDIKLREQVFFILKNTDHVKFAQAAVDARTAMDDLSAIRQFIGATQFKVSPETDYSNMPKRLGVMA